jgi:hypothetical protein
MKPINFKMSQALLLSAFVLAGCNQGFELVSIQPNQNSNSNSPTPTIDPIDSEDPDSPANNIPSDPPSGGGGSDPNLRTLMNATFTDSQTPQVSGQADILFVIDNSGSMSEEQQMLANNFQTFISGLTASSNTFNYRIGITSTDFAGTTGVSFSRTQAYSSFLNFGPGGLISKLLSPASSTPKYLTSDMDPDFVRSQFVASANLGTGGSGYENGIETFRRFLTLTTPGRVNSDFMRDDNTRLDVILISDEDAHNPSNQSQYLRANTSAFNSYLDQTVAQISAAKNGRGANMIKYHSIVGFENSNASCSLFSTGGLRGEGLAYLALSNRTGGMKIDLCRSENFANDLLTLGSVISSSIRRVFSLNQVPANVANIKVFLNGTLIPQSTTNGWSYTESSNSVTIHGMNLESLTRINVQVDYQYWSN